MNLQFSRKYVRVKNANFKHSPKAKLQFDGGPEDSVLVMPLDSLPVPMETLVTDENQIRTIHVGDYTPSVITTGEETFIASADSTANCVVQKHKPVSSKQPNWLSARLPKSVKQLKSDKIFYADKSSFLTNPGGKRGLIRFGRSRMIADTHTAIAVSEFKNQLNDTSDIIGRLDLAPSTKAMMHLLNTKGVNKLFANPGRVLGARIRNGFIRHLSIKQTPVEVTYTDMPLLPIGYTPTVDPKTIKRITRKRRYPEAEEYQRKMSDAYIMKAEEVEEAEYEEVIIPDCKESVILISNMESAHQPLLDDKGNIYNDEFSPSIAAIEEQELDSFPFADSLGSGTEIAESQEYDPSDEFITGEEYSCQDQFQDNKATIIMIENDNMCENVQVVLSTSQECSLDEDSQTQVIFCDESDEDMKEIMIVPDEPVFTETVVTS